MAARSNGRAKGRSVIGVNTTITWLAFTDNKMFMKCSNMVTIAPCRFMALYIT